MKRTEGTDENGSLTSKSRSHPFPTIQSLGSVVHGDFLGNNGVPDFSLTSWVRDTLVSAGAKRLSADDPYEEIEQIMRQSSKSGNV